MGRFIVADGNRNNCVLDGFVLFMLDALLGVLFDVFGVVATGCGCGLYDMVEMKGVGKWSLWSGEDD